MAAILRKSPELPTIHSSQLVLPQWIGDLKKITLEIDGKHHLGRLLLDNDKGQFQSSTSKLVTDLPNFALIYNSLLYQQLLLSGWHSNVVPAAAAAHVSAAG
eukprot:15365571-Ditylum_brightwellii.AAC.1